MDLGIIASELSMIIFENDYLSEYKITEKLEKYIEENYSKLMPCDISYVIDKAYEIYGKI